jgi:hypothetical protein
MSTIQRYQDIEGHRKQAVTLILNEPRTVKEEAYITHHVSRLACEIQASSHEILETLRVPIPRASDPLAAFHADMERRIEFHQQIAESTPEPPPMTEETPEDLKPESMNDLVFGIKGTAHLSLF